MSNSSKASAKVLSKQESELVVLELSDDIIEDANALMVGAPIDGVIYLTIHSCPYCHNEMETIGIAHGIFECSNCAAVRSRRIEMARRFKCLEKD